MAMAISRLDWTREEIILAMDLYFTSGAMGGGSVPSENSIATIELSGLLKELSAYPSEVQSAKYRNPDGVYLKLMNLRVVETNGAHGMNSYSRRDAAV
jgi:5-methylcytosine-specific restriction enzyme A